MTTPAASPVPLIADSANQGNRAYYWCEYAWLPQGVTAGVLVETDGVRIREVSTVDACPSEAERLAGVVLPGFANAHSHAFHRALRGRTVGDSFWSWRQGMYTLANRLDPDAYLRLATAAYAEMALAGVSCVGEFHYVHHLPDGSPYAEPNVMGDALRAAAGAAGIRLTLLDTCYLAGGIGEPLAEAQRRFGDRDATAWAHRFRDLREDGTTRIGAAIHSVRAVPRDQLGTVAAAAAGRPLHVHLSEQPAENEAARAAYGATPTAVLHDAGVLGPHTTAVHATHLTGEDIGLLGGSRTGACFCPTTEADLADGIGPARDLADAGSPLSLGSDQHAIIDLLEEGRRIEHHERLRTGRRGRFTPAELVAALTNHAALGWPDAGAIAPGARADLVAVRLDSVRTAGVWPEELLLAAGAADIHTTVVDGRVVARDGVHATLGDVGRLLSDAIEAVWA